MFHVKHPPFLFLKNILIMFHVKHIFKRIIEESYRNTYQCFTRNIDMYIEISVILFYDRNGVTRKDE